MLPLILLAALVGCLSTPVYYPAILYDWSTCHALLGTLTSYDCSEIVNKQNSMPAIYRIIPHGPLICLPPATPCQPLVQP